MSRAHHSSLLWSLTALFFLRVYGQIMVGVYEPSFLPPWVEWYSGLLPYPWLLACQMSLLMFMTVVNVDHGRGTGPFCLTSAIMRRRLRGFAMIYASGMLLRHGIHVTLVPEARWFGGFIPVFFHWVLAAWLWVLTVPVPRFQR